MSSSVRQVGLVSSRWAHTEDLHVKELQGISKPAFRVAFVVNFYTSVCPVTH